MKKNGRKSGQKKDGPEVMMQARMKATGCMWTLGPNGGMTPSQARIPNRPRTPNQAQAEQNLK